MDKENIKRSIVKTIGLEAKALQYLSENIEDQFCEAIACIFRNEGRLVITGIGKSAIIAQKIVATLNSTGTPSIFLHAADAIHGDIGMIDSKDIVICFSKSGNTPEIKAIIPIIKSFGNKLIGVTANSSSFLAESSDYHILTPVEREADPNNLAPTVSTSCQMAVGDAIAMSLLELKGFSSSEFAKFHPGGSLGKQLYLKVEDVIRNNKRPSVEESDNIRTVILSITSGMLGATAVCRNENQILGIITDGDIRRMLEKYEDTTHIRATDIMTRSPKSIEAEELAVNALQLIRENKITQLVVTKEGRYHGIIHLHDLVREGII